MRRSRAVALPASVRLGGRHPLQFGVGRRWMLQLAEGLPHGLRDDVRLFLTTYAAGFVGVSLFLA